MYRTVEHPVALADLCGVTDFQSCKRLMIQGLAWVRAHHPKGRMALARPGLSIFSQTSVDSKRLNGFGRENFHRGGGPAFDPFSQNSRIKCGSEARDRIRAKGRLSPELLYTADVYRFVSGFGLEAAKFISGLLSEGCGAGRGHSSAGANRRSIWGAS